MSKAFDQALYDADDAAKHLVIKWLRSRNVVAFVNPDEYGIDLLARYNDSDYAFEVEVKHNWKGFEFPYQTIHYSARKRKFISPDVKTYFVTLNHERTHLLLVHQQDFMLGKLVNKDTIYTTSEWFVEIPIHRVIFREILEEEL
jgi:hypothetical protein